MPYDILVLLLSLQPQPNIVQRHFSVQSADTQTYLSAIRDIDCLVSMSIELSCALTMALALDSTSDTSSFLRRSVLVVVSCR